MSPASMRSNVDFPHPLGPTSAVSVPGSTSNETFDSTGRVSARRTNREAPGSRKLCVMPSTISPDSLCREVVIRPRSIECGIIVEHSRLHQELAEPVPNCRFHHSKVALGEVSRCVIVDRAHNEGFIKLGRPSKQCLRTRFRVR